eukprot:270488_1
MFLHFGYSAIFRVFLCHTEQTVNTLVLVAVNLVIMSNLYTYFISTFYLLSLTYRSLLASTPGYIQYISTPTDWTTANSYCKVMGGELITATSFSTNIQKCENSARADLSNPTALWVGLSLEDTQLDDNSANCAHLELLFPSGYQIKNVDQMTNNCDVSLPYCCDINQELSDSPISSGGRFPALPVAQTSAPTPKPSTTTTSVPSMLTMAVLSQTEAIQTQTATDDINAFNSDKAKTNHTLVVLPAIPIETIAFLMIIVLFITTLYHFYLSADKRSKIPSAIMIPVLLAFVFNITGIIGIGMVSIIMHTSTTWNTSAFEQALVYYFMTFVSYSCGKFCLETFFINRLNNVFGETAFALSKPVTTVLFLCMVLLLCMSCYMFSVDEASILGVHHSIIFIIYGAMESCLVLTLLWLFVKRLGRLILQRKTETQRNIEMSSTQTTTKSLPQQSAQSDTSTQPKIIRVSSNNEAIIAGSPPPPAACKMDGDGAKAKVTLTRDQSRLIFLITRCILLSTISLATTIIFTLYLFWYMDNGNGVPIYVLYSLWTIDMWINSVCLYLNFSFANRVYDKYCNRCHKGCQNVMEHCTVRRIIVINQKAI